MKRIILLLLFTITICIAGAKPVTTRLKISNAQSKPKIETMAKRIPGVTNATYSTTNKTLLVTYDNKKTNTSKIRAAVKKAGYKIGSYASSVQAQEKVIGKPSNASPFANSQGTIMRQGSQTSSTPKDKKVEGTKPKVQPKTPLQGAKSKQ